jgi:hypothetical protein
LRRLLDGDMSDKLLSPETVCLNTLADAWNQFLVLDELHEWDRTEFMHAIHACQHIVMARPGFWDKIHPAPLTEAEK